MLPSTVYMLHHVVCKSSTRLHDHDKRNTVRQEKFKEKIVALVEKLVAQVKIADIDRQGGEALTLSIRKSLEYLISYMAKQDDPDYMDDSEAT